MKPGPLDPYPTRITTCFQKVYHWTWKLKKGKPMLVLHRGDDEGCKRVHYYPNGAKVKA